MKNYYFTALAVVAFSGVAIANTGEVKEEVVVNYENKVEIITETIVQEDYFCMAYAIVATDQTDLGPVATHDFYQAMLGLCHYLTNL